MTFAVDIAEAVTAALKRYTFSHPFVAQRLYRPAFDLAEMKDLHVTVVPKGIEIATVGRGITQYDIQVDLAVQKKLQTAGNDEIDALMGLVQEIADFVRSTGRFNEGVWVKTENSPIYSQEHLSELRQFTSVLTVTVRVMA